MKSSPPPESPADALQWVPAFAGMTCISEVKGGTYDAFHIFAEVLKARPELVKAYNALKQAHHGQPMETYRIAKGEFINRALALNRFTT